MLRRPRTDCPAVGLVADTIAGSCRLPIAVESLQRSPMADLFVQLPAEVAVGACGG